MKQGCPVFDTPWADATHPPRFGAVPENPIGPRHRASRTGFTLVELLVSVAVLALIMVLISQLFNSALAVTNLGNKHMDSDAQVRAIFDRMQVDFGQILARPDVDYFLKTSGTDQYGNANAQYGSATSGSNDQIAFYSQVPGYYPSTSGTAQQSPLSLVAYRVNTDSTSPYYNELQRLGYGLLWNGATTSGTMPMVFSSGTSGATCCISGTNNAIYNNWPTATNMVADANYEPAGPQVFRMEYYYLLKGQTVAGVPYTAMLSDIPWDVRIPNHISVDGLQDVAAIGVVVAVIDAKSRVLVTSSQLAALAAQLLDFPQTSQAGFNTTQPGTLENLWQTTINNSTAIPHVATSAIRVYGRTFYLPTGSNPNL